MFDHFLCYLLVSCNGKKLCSSGTEKTRKMPGSTLLEMQSIFFFHLLLKKQSLKTPVDPGYTENMIFQNMILTATDFNGVASRHTCTKAR